MYASALVDYGFAQGDIGRAMAQFADSRSAMRGIIGYDEQEQATVTKALTSRSLICRLFNFFNIVHGSPYCLYFWALTKYLYIPKCDIRKSFLTALVQRCINIEVNSA